MEYNFHNLRCVVFQEEGEQYGQHVDKIEQYLLEFAKLAEDVNLRKQALDNILESTSQMEEDEVRLADYKHSH